MSVVCREEEYSDLRGHVNAFLETEESSIVYVSGVPGSGKTYTVCRLLDAEQIPHAFANAAGLRRKADVYGEILKRLPCEVEGSGLAHLRMHFETCSRTHVVVIDEIDLLISRGQAILYNIFDMPYLPSSKVLLVAISNTMDLPERMLEPKVSSRIGRRRINFVPYSAADLQVIGSGAGIGEKPLELASKRIGSVSGDARRMLDVVCRARESGKTELGDIDSTMRKMYAPLYVQYLQGLTLYQKMVVGVLKGAERHRMGVREVYDDVVGVCRRTETEEIDFLVFGELGMLLERYGIVKYRNARKEMCLMVLPEEIDLALGSDEAYLERRI